MWDYQYQRGRYSVLPDRELMFPNNYTILIPYVRAVIRDDEGRRAVAEPLHGRGVYLKGHTQRSGTRAAHLHPNGASMDPSFEAQFEPAEFTAAHNQHGGRRSIRPPCEDAVVQ